MMIGEPHRNHHHGPPWPESINSTAQITSPISPSSSSPLQSNGAPHSPTYYDAVLASLRRYILTAGVADHESSAPADLSGDVEDFVAGEYDDEFFMYDFKIRKCTRARAHDWTECPFAHPGEKARRRDPRKYSYSGTACSEFRKGNCRKGDGCEFAHGVFECWLHPSRFRTQACKDGPGCKRRVCFFAHSSDQLRIGGSLGSPRTQPGPEDGFGLGELAASLRNLQLNKVKSMPSSWNVQVGGSPVFGSPRGAGIGSGTAMGRAGFFSLPTTPTRPAAGFWDSKEVDQDGEPVLERVESGRELRARMFEKLSKENPLNGSIGPTLAHGPGPGPDLGWVSDLIE